MPYLARIALFPIKALDGIIVPQARLLPAGCLEHDRRFAIRDQLGRYVNGKRAPLVHLLRPTFDYPALRWVRLSAPDRDPAGPFPLEPGAPALADWLSGWFSEPVTILENREAGWPDDTEAPGPTVVSTASLQAVASWFPGLTLDEVRARFRANLEVGGVEPFWEDRLCGEQGQPVRFHLGPVVLEGVNPCQRCVVPTRDSRTAEASSGFQKAFAERRRQHLPTWAPVSRFDHTYRLAVNTRPACAGGLLRVGDEVRLEG